MQKKPWSVENFINKARGAGHPALLDMRIPADLEVAIDKNTSWTVEQISKYRSDWCRHWLKRAKELESEELRDRENRPDHVKHSTQSKRILVTREILESIGYEDVQALDFLKHGSTLAGSIESCNIFENQFKPCLLTLEQLEQGAARRNQAILAMTVSSGAETVDRQVLEETRVELERGWARGPFKLEDLPDDCVISRRFPLAQSNKTRMIDDFSISGVNDSCTIHSKIDLHMIDTLGAVVRKYFQRCSGAKADSRLWAKTFDLKSAYRQVPIRSDHLKYAFFSIYNPESQGVEIYQLLTLPFGATHSVYSFLRPARMIHTAAAKALYVLNTNFYDDFVLLSNPEASKSANLSMEVLFLLTGWEFAKEGKKSTTFGELCSALGVTFDLSNSESRIARIYNTEQRRVDLISKLEEVLKCGELSKHDSLVLRGRLGFADSFLHGRLGGLLLKKLVEHAYSRQKTLDPSTKQALAAMKLRLELGQPVEISDKEADQWFIHTDAAYEQSSKDGGLGAVVLDCEGTCKAWFGIGLDPEHCKCFGSGSKDSIIYELELLAAVLAFWVWDDRLSSCLVTWFGDNDSVRFSLIRGSGTGCWGEALMEFYLRQEVKLNTQTWFARVPTEANVSDWPSRLCRHELLNDEKDCSVAARHKFQSLCDFVNKHVGLHEEERGRANRTTPSRKRSDVS